MIHRTQKIDDGNRFLTFSNLVRISFLIDDSSMRSHFLQQLPVFLNLYRCTKFLNGVFQIYSKDL